MKIQIAVAVIVIGFVFLLYCHHRWTKQSRTLDNETDSERRRRKLGIKVVE